MLNFNVDPYYDDFDPNKNYHRILFKPGRAVQARELTQSQTILQDQISKFADHIFKQNTPVTGGQVTVNTRSIYLKLNTTYNDNDVVAEDFKNQIITDLDGIIAAKVVATEEAVSGDPPTLIITYLSGKEFSAGDVIVGESGQTAQIAPSNYTGYATTASISQGVFYIVNGYTYSDIQNEDGTYSRYSIGNFVSVQPQTTIVQKYGNTPTRRVGLTISEYISDYVTDPSLLDPAVGATNYQAPGADRYTIKLTLTSLPITSGSDSGFIELVRITDGVVQRLVDGTVYGVIDDYFAKRTYDTNGDFVVNDFRLVPRANTSNPQTYQVQIGSGTAYVKGYRTETVLQTIVEANRARDTTSLNNQPVTLDYGNYIYVNNANGVFDVTKVTQVDFHTINANSSIVTTNNTTYSSTKAGSAYIRGLEFDSYSDVANTKTYVYKAYLSEIVNYSVSSNAAATGTGTTIQFYDQTGMFSSVANAYYGVTITIDSGKSAGDTRKIVSYNGSTKTATVDSAFTMIPDTTSNFSLRFNNGNFNLMVSPTSSGYSRNASAGIDPSSKVSNVSNNPTVLQNPTSPELIFNVGNPYMYSLNDQSYESWKMSRSVTFASGVGSFSLTGDIVFQGSVGVQSVTEGRENWLAVVTTAGGSFAVGDVIRFDGSTNTISLDSTKKIATLTAGSSTFTATILARTYITNAGTTSVALKQKNKITANTTNVNLSGTDVGGIKVDLTNAQVYIPNQYVVTPGTKQSLYISDVKRIVKIIDTLSPTDVPTDAMLTNDVYDVTDYFSFDNEQNDSYYGHSSIRLIPGSPQPKGNLLVLVEYYQHAGGDGYFSVGSYLGAGDGGVSTSPENYAEIGSYTGKVSGITYNLRDCIDYRLSTVNAQAVLEFRYSTSVTGTGGALIPVDNSEFITDYSYYLARNDILVLTKDNSFKLITGKSSVTPTFPQQPDGSLLLAKFTLDPYTAYLPGETTNYLPNLSMEKVQHKRWRMQDISDLQSRVNNLEYYTSLSLLEKQAAELQIPDENGLNRFKNGILVDNFTGYATVDAADKDFNAKINKRLTVMTAADTVVNAPLFNKDGLNSLGKLSTYVQDQLNYRYHTTTGGTTTIVTLPYTTANLAVQKLASNTVSLNPFAVSVDDGVLDINPPMDMWIENTREPDLLIVDPTQSLFRQGTTLNTFSTSDWQTISGTQVTTRQITSVSGRTATATVSTYETQQRDTVTGYYDKVSSINSNFITDVSVQPYIRAQNLELRASGMKVNTPVSVFIDDVNVNQYLTVPNIIELTNVNWGQNIGFRQGDVIGFMSGGNFVPTGRILSLTILQKTNNLPSRVRLYVSSDVKTTTYSNTNIIQNAYFNQNGTYAYSTANGIYINAGSTSTTVHTSGQVVGYSGGTVQSQVGATANAAGIFVTGANSITLANTASSVNDFYVGAKLYMWSLKQFKINRDEAGRAYTVNEGNRFYFTPGPWTNNGVNGGGEPAANASIITLQVGSGYSGGDEPTVIAYNGTTKVATLSKPVNVSLGSSMVSGSQVNYITRPVDLTSTYQLVGTQYVMAQGVSNQKLPRLSTDEHGNFSTTLKIPPGTFKTGDRVIRVDNRTVDSDPNSATTYAQGIFTASSLATKSQSLNFGATVQAAAKSSIFTKVEKRSVLVSKVDTTFTIDPVAQTFIIDQNTYPNGAFIKSIKVFFKSKPTTTNAPAVKLSIVDTINGYPSGQVIDGSLVTKTVQEINISDTPHYLDRTTYTEFTFDAPVYIRSGNLYAFMLQTTSPDYVIWIAQQNGIAVPSSVKNLPTDVTPTSITKIGGTPYVGALFESQNAITWTADQTKQMMFVLDNCVFNTSANPSIDYVIPKQIPTRKMVGSELEYALDANNISFGNGTFFRKDLTVDAFNFTTTDFEPTGTSLSYTYTPTLFSTYTADSTFAVEPGKFGTTMVDHIYLDDGKGARVIDANSNSSLKLTATLSTTDKYVSPVLSDDGLSVYIVKNYINDMGISNTNITVTSGNTAGVTANYSSTPPAVTISAPTGIGGTQATATANLVYNPATTGYYVDKINITNPGSGYITTPTITIASNGSVSATATVVGETSARGGNASCRYITKKVTLSAENESGDLRVYYSAYKPPGSKILVYYKILSRNDTAAFEDQNWQLMTEINTGANNFSKNRDDIIEFVSAPGTGNNPDNFITYTSTTGQSYNSFNVFAIKIVLATSDSTRTPIVHDLRVLALPSGV